MWKPLEHESKQQEPSPNSQINCSFNSAWNKTSGVLISSPCAVIHSQRRTVWGPRFSATRQPCGPAHHQPLAIFLIRLASSFWLHLLKAASLFSVCIGRTAMAQDMDVKGAYCYLGSAARKGSEDLKVRRNREGSGAFSSCEEICVHRGHFLWQFMTKIRCSITLHE